MAWQKVSCSPACAKTSRLAYARASSAPRSSVEHRVRQQSRQSCPFGAVADDHHPHRVVVRQRCQPLHVLLRRQPSDESDDQPLPLPHPLTTQGLVASGRIEQLRVDAPAPPVQSRNPFRCKGFQSCTGRNEGSVAHLVQAPGVSPRCPRGHPEAIRVGEARDVGLEHRDRGDLEASSDHRRRPTHHERRREMHDIGFEIAQRPVQHGRGDANRQRRHPRHLHRRQQVHRGASTHHPRTALGAACRVRGDHHGLVAGAFEVVDDPENGVHDPVDLRKKALGGDCDAHAARISE